MTRPFVLAAGGTGGHRFPAEALAAELIGHGRRVHLLTDARGDAFAAAPGGIEVHRLRAGQPGRGPLRDAYACAGIAAGTLQAVRLLRRLAPAGVVGFGGYPSLPPMLAAAYLRLPTLIHEQNAVLGRANRLLAPRIRRIATGFPAVSGLHPADGRRAIHTGNPVRPAILAAAEVPYRAPPPGGPAELLVLGGSQGARIFGEILPPTVAALPAELRAVLRVSQQVRPEDLTLVAGRYAEAGIAAELDSFFADVPQRLARAQLVICRAGASTIAELAAVGRPALLVPYPHATDDHQSANARAFAESGGGWVAAQMGLEPTALSAWIAELFAGPARLAQAAQRALLFGRRNAARHLARLTLELDGCPAERAA